MSITVQDVEALRSLLAELPRHEAREVTKQEAVALLASEIRAAQRRGYPPEELARILSERGVPINVATLRGYLRRTRKVRKTTKVRPHGADQGPAAGTREEDRSPADVPGASAPTTNAAPPAPIPPNRGNTTAGIGADAAHSSAALPTRR